MLTGHNSTLTLMDYSNECNHNTSTLCLLYFFHSSAIDTGNFYKFGKDKLAMVSIVGEIE